MAAAAAQVVITTTTRTIECGFCLRKDGALPEPKELPCGHVHCLNCLTAYFEENHTVLCPVQQCGEVFDGSPDSLPSHDMGGADDKSCDVCVQNKLSRQEAVIYCTVCCKKFCRKHQQDHDSVLSEHSKISMEEYRAEAMRLQTTVCAKHGNHVYILACKLCLTLSCVKCVGDLGLCDNGAAHSLLSLDDLVAALMKEDISAKMLAKEEQYERLFKCTSKARAEYDNKTTEIIQLIHDTRDAQVEALKVKYKKLEEEVIEKRQKSRVDMAEFMEDLVLKKWTQLRNGRRMLESRVKGSQLAVVVRGFKEMKVEMQKFVEKGLPKLQLEDELELKTLEENREIELGVVPSHDIVIDGEQGLTAPRPLPQSVTLLKSVQLPAHPISVCRYNKSTYVGLYNGTVTRIDNNYQLYNSFISTSGHVESISVYKDRLYLLCRSDPRVVNVYDTAGRHVTSWEHLYQNYYCNMLTVVADQVVVADPTNKRITVYSLTGESLHHIPCPQLGSDHTTMCAVDNTSVVISDDRSSQVFRVSIATGELLWSLSDVNEPQSLVRYGSYVLLAAYNNRIIYILDTTTGKIVSEMADSSIAGGHVFGLEVYDTTLVVAKFNSKQALYFQLN